MNACAIQARVTATAPTPLVRRTVLVVALVVAGLSAAAIGANAVFARRLAGALLADSQQQEFARALVRGLGVACLISSITLLIGRRAFLASYGRLLAVAALASVAVFAAASIAFWWYVNDDAGITFTFARNLAEGHGLVFNIGEPPVEGYSNPLWVLFLAGARVAGLDIILVAKSVGLACAAACLLLLLRMLRGESPLAWLALPLTATSAAFIIWGNSGLENGLHSLLITAVAVLLGRGGRSKLALAGLVAVLGLLVLSRPEGIVFAIAATAWLLVARRGPPASRFAAALALLVPALVLAALTGFRWFYFHDVLPNTFYAKASASNPLRLLNPFSGGWQYVAAAVSGCGWSLALVPLLFLLGKRADRSPFVGPAAALVAAQVFFVVTVGGDWMGEFRFLQPVVPLVSLLIGHGFATLWRTLTGWLNARVVPALVCGVPAAIIATSQLPRLIAFAERPTTPLDAVARIGQYFVDLARQAGIEHPTLLHHDAGGTSYVSRITLIDLGGLCDRTIAKHARDREIIRKYIFEERRPTFIYSTRLFARKIDLEGFPEFERDYAPLPPAPSPELDGDIRRVRRDAAGKLVYSDRQSSGAARR